MADPETQFLELPPYAAAGDAAPPRRIAYRVRNRPPSGRAAPPVIVWLTGLKSSMNSVKATALDNWAVSRDRGLVRFDYSGHGQSSGRFEDGRVGAWIEDANAVIEHVLPQTAPRVLIASSMGAHVALKLLLSPSVPWRTATAQAILIAPAWDATEELMWQKFSPAIKAQVLTEGVYRRPSRYGDGDYSLTLGLIEDGRQHLLPRGPLAVPCPVHILHGALDPDVPLAHGVTLAKRMASGRPTLEIVPDGDHRLSRPQDLERLFTALDQVA